MIWDAVRLGVNDDSGIGSEVANNAELLIDSLEDDEVDGCDLSISNIGTVHMDWGEGDSRVCAEVGWTTFSYYTTFSEESFPLEPEFFDLQSLRRDENVGLRERVRRVL